MSPFEKEEAEMEKYIGMKDDSMFRKSSRSFPYLFQNHCVEVALDGETINIRDSKHPDGSQLSFNHCEWRAFIEGVKAGEFDLP